MENGDCPERRKPTQLHLSGSSQQDKYCNLHNNKPLTSGFSRYHTPGELLEIFQESSYVSPINDLRTYQRVYILDLYSELLLHREFPRES